MKNLSNMKKQLLAMFLVMAIANGINAMKPPPVPGIQFTTPPAVPGRAFEETLPSAQKGVILPSPETAPPVPSRQIITSAQGLIYLQIQNNTDYDFSIYQTREPYQSNWIGNAESHSLNHINELPWSDFKGTNSRFDLKYGSMQLNLTVNYRDESTYNASLTSFTRQGEVVIVENKIEKTITGTDNDVYITLTLEGKEENNLAGSSIKLELKVITPEMKLQREPMLLEREREQLERQREKEQMQLEASRLKQIEQQQRKTIMDIIKELAPSLYQEIVAVDPNGDEHIGFSDRDGAMNATVNISTQDGFPKINLGSLASQIPREQLKFIIAHELGHYALRHISLQATSTEKTVQHAFGRSKENEADRFAVMELGANIDDAIAAQKTLRDYSYKTPSALQSTHPIAEARIEHFEELRREKEAQRKKPEAINWKELANYYKKVADELAKKRAASVKKIVHELAKKKAASYKKK